MPLELIKEAEERRPVGDPHAPAVGQVMAVGGLTADGWYREMLRRDGSRRLVLVDDR
jgi:hypothetical protein